CQPGPYNPLSPTKLPVGWVPDHDDPRARQEAGHEGAQGQHPGQVPPAAPLLEGHGRTPDPRRRPGSPRQVLRAARADHEARLTPTRAAPQPTSTRTLPTSSGPT